MLLLEVLRLVGVIRGLSEVLGVIGGQLGCVVVNGRAMIFIMVLSGL